MEREVGGRFQRLTTAEANRQWYRHSGYLSAIVCKFMPALVDYINVVNICTYLLAEELLTFDERSEILDLKGKHLQVPHLFKILTTKGADWYNRFWRALQNSVSWNDVHLGHKDLLEILPSATDKGALEQSNGQMAINSLTQDQPSSLLQSLTTTGSESKNDLLLETVKKNEKCNNILSVENQYLVQENECLREENRRLEGIIGHMEHVLTEKRRTWV